MGDFINRDLHQNTPKAKMRQNSGQCSENEHTITAIHAT